MGTKAAMALCGGAGRAERTRRIRMKRRGGAVASGIGTPEQLDGVEEQRERQRVSGPGLQPNLSKARYVTWACSKTKTNKAR